jgi:hypothetical protein
MLLVTCVAMISLQRMPGHVRRIRPFQSAWKVSDERGRDPGIIGQRRRQQLVVEPDLAVGEQDGTLRTGEACPLAPLDLSSVGRNSMARLSLPPFQGIA